MKPILLIVLIAALMGCKPSSIGKVEKPAEPKTMEYIESGRNYYILLDTKTGYQYLMATAYGNGVSIIRLEGRNK